MKFWKIVFFAAFLFSCACQSEVDGEVITNIMDDMREDTVTVSSDDIFFDEDDATPPPETQPVMHSGCWFNKDCDDGDACTRDECDLKTGLCFHEPADCDDGDPSTDDWCDPDVGCINWSQTCVQDVHYELWTDMVSGPKIKGDIPDVSLGCCDSDLDCMGSPWGDQCSQESMPMVGFGLHGSGKYEGLCHECEDNCDCPLGKECVLELQDLLTQDELDAHHDELGQDFIGAPRRPVLRCQ